MIMKFILPSVITAGFFVCSGVLYYITDLQNQIKELNEKLRLCELDLVKTKTDLMVQNQKIVEQSFKISKYNNFAPIYKANVENKYSNFTSSNDCNQNMGIINEMLLRQGFRHEKKY